MPVPCSPTDSLACPTSAPFSQSPEIAYFTSAVRSRLSLLRAFLASRTATPGSDRPAPMSATSGANVPESLASYDPASHSLRTYQVSLLPREDGSSTECLVTWPASGTLVAGKCYPQGRGLVGDNHPSTKLHSFYLPEVRRRYASGERLRSIARSFGVSVPCISTANSTARHLRSSTRGQPGEENPQSKLSPDQVAEVRHLSNLGFRGKDLARTFSISRSQVSRIIRRQSWR